MRIRRTFKSEHPNSIFDTPLEDFPLSLLHQQDEMRMGFEKGTLLKATLEYSTGVTITYEKVED